MNMWPQEEINSEFPVGATIQYSLIQRCWWLYRTKLPWVMRIDCIWQRETNKNHFKILHNLFELLKTWLGGRSDSDRLQDNRELNLPHPSFAQFHPFFAPFLTKEIIDRSTEILRVTRGWEGPINEILLLKYKPYWRGKHMH